MEVIVVTAENGDSAEELSEYHGSVDWQEISREDLVSQYSDYVSGPDFGHWQSDGPGRVYSVIDQFADAALGSPGVVYAFKTNGPHMPTVILKYEGDTYWVGNNTDPMGFASVSGNDGDQDENDLPIYPAPVGGGHYMESLIESLVDARRGRRRRGLSVQEADLIAEELLR